jgi:hypothetical protein
MQEKIDPFSRVTSDRVLPDRHSQAACGGLFSATTPNSGPRPGPSAIQYRRVTTCTGELDGAKGVDGG